MKLIQPLSKVILQLRLQARMTQSQMAQKAEMTKVRVCKVERGIRKPRLDELTRIASVYGMTTEVLIADTDWGARPLHEHDPEIDKRFGVEAPPLHRPDFTFEHRLQAAIKINPRLVRDLARKIGEHPWSREMLIHLQHFWVDSGPEVLYWLQVAALDCYPIRHSLPALGLRDWPLICPRTGETIGDIPRPGLWVKWPVEGLFFPQITLLPGTRSQRVDCIACFGGGRWVGIEIDGDGHNGRWDPLREQDLRWPVGRLTTSEVQDQNFEKRLVGLRDNLLRNPRR